jgi:hypothetical protein
MTPLSVQVVFYATSLRKIPREKSSMNGRRRMFNLGESANQGPTEERDPGFRFSARCKKPRQRPCSAPL